MRSHTIRVMGLCAALAGCAADPDAPASAAEQGEPAGHRAESSAAVSGSSAGAAGHEAGAGASGPVTTAGTLAMTAGTHAQANVSAGQGGAEAGRAGSAGSSAGAAAVGGSVGGIMASGGAGGAGMHAGPWKLMMLGDSIVGNTCYPQLVSKELIDEGHTNITLVGTQTNNQSCNATNVMEEGHGGYGVTYLPQNSMRAACQKPACGSYAELQSWAAEAPEIVIMHYGTNDVWDGQSTDSILNAYAAVIDEFRKHNPAVIFFVSKIIKLDPMGCTNCLRDVGALAAALTDVWAMMNTTPSSPVWIVDDYDSGFDPDDRGDTADGVHPTPSGSQKMADATTHAVTAKGYF